MKYNLYISSDLGKVRENNEDNFSVGTVMRNLVQNKINLKGLEDDSHLLCAVFDGMGGEACGDIASHICAEEATLLQKQIKKTGHLDNDMVNAYVQKANDRIVEIVRENGAHRGGSTFAMVYLNDGKIYPYSLGDSRIYLYRNSEVKQISIDHTLAMKKYRANIYSLEEALASADSHKLTSFIGVDSENQGLQAEAYDALTLEKGDKLLLCSDGLYDMCSDTVIAKLLARDSQTFSRDLVKAALHYGGIDNITCIVIELADEQ